MNATRGSSSAPVVRWKIGPREIVIDRPILVGILNVTPDSFSDGGNFFSGDAAVAQAERLIEDGAHVIDIGGESTRPGAQRVDTNEEVQRVIPILGRLRKDFPKTVLSVDTVKSEVARRALDAGADVINDVSGLTLDPAMKGIAAERGCGVIVMHSRGDVETMGTYSDADYGGAVIREVTAVLAERSAAALSAGIARDAIVLDPGIGFSKHAEDSLRCIAGLDELAALGFPVLVGLSRKRTVVEALTAAGWDRERAVASRDFATAGANVTALQHGARLFRVHDVRGNRAALDAAWAVMTALNGVTAG